MKFFLSSSFNDDDDDENNDDDDVNADGFDEAFRQSRLNS